MSIKQEFIEFVEKVVQEFNVEMPEGAQKYFDTMKSVPEKEKPMFTDGGKQILKYMKDNHVEGETVTAKRVAEGMGISSRSVSGALRKLVTDGFMEKAGTDPVVYALTYKGVEVIID